ncbi:MAG: hypothetical protein WBW04_23395 [Nitrolancea sp.]
MPQRTLYRQADAFGQQGMASLVTLPSVDRHQQLPAPIRQAILASGLSRTQGLTAYLLVFYAAIRQHVSSEVLVSDGGAMWAHDSRSSRLMPPDKERLPGEHILIRNYTARSSSNRDSCSGSVIIAS